jgi:hypothetical protein
MRAARVGGRVLAAALLLALTACGSQTGGGTTSPTASAPPADPLGLIGLWHVSGATALPRGEHAVLRLAPGEVSLWRDCGVSFGSWRAGDGLLLLDPGESATGDCAAAIAGSADPSSSWLATATRYEPDGEGWRLLARDGAQVARLLPGATLDPRPDLAASLSEPPVVDAAARQAMAEPAALGDDLSPATRTTTIGRWRPSAASGGLPAGKPPFLSVAADGTWTGWDGCNATSGRWLVGDAGRLLVTAGPHTLIGCDGFDLPALWASTARVGLAGGLLVLLDREGRELVRLKGPDVVATGAPGPSRAPSPTRTHGPVLR